MADLRTVYQQAGRNRWWFAAAALAMTIGVFSVIWQEGGHGLPRAPQVTYISSWPEGRSQAEIIATNQANQRYQDRLAAEQARREENVRGIYKAIGRASGMDVEAIEKKAVAERAAEKAAADAEAARVRALQEKAALVRQ